MFAVAFKLLLPSGIITALGFETVVLAAPASPVSTSPNFPPSVESALASVLNGIESDAETFTGYAYAVVNILEEVVTPNGTLTSIPEALSELSSLAAGSPTSVADYSVGLLLKGLSRVDLDQALEAYAEGLESPRQTNTREPRKVIYPKKSQSDAPYSVSEAGLRSALLIPSTFEYGQEYQSKSTTSEKLRQIVASSSVVDPVELSIPGFTLGDIQVTAEYVAYAINYLSAVSGNKNVEAISWFQGSIDKQWALRYWPSTRSIISDFIPFSSDFHGTLFSDLECPGFPGLPCPMAPRQQRTDSNLIKTLIANGGDSAYVPTTTIYSIFDEIVLPQDDKASGHINDARGVGASNNELQSLCPDLPARDIYTHEGVLHNSVGLGGYASTEGIIPVDAVLILTHQPQTSEEPAIMPYAT
ncbi:uncharacterized protein PAC_04574 [Phialocephala subalpina]|uniref:Lipase B n=1 Tax=Phialocephala subalpina TaxID=576137 RepID=A0A1L7WPJ0_9HELO|nr:uncharacterized protein PAC_04574 [Phialocephala subalpina]